MAGGGLGYRIVPGAPNSPEEMIYTHPESPVKETYVVQPKRLGAHSNEPKNVCVSCAKSAEVKNKNIEESQKINTENAEIKARVPSDPINR